MRTGKDVREATITGFDEPPRNPGRPDPLDVHIGQRLRMRRKSLGLTQCRVASVLGVSAQQLRKYENGTTRMSAAALYRLAYQLGVPIMYFFCGSDPA